jgi:hypothetical protein
VILRLISPDEEFEYVMWQDSKPPAVIIGHSHEGDQRVWVRGANSHGDNNLYYEQFGSLDVSLPGLKKVR